MSQLIGNALPQFVLMEKDNRNHMKLFLTVAVLDGERADSYVSAYWPGTGFIGDRPADVSVIDAISRWWEYPEITKGKASRFVIVGVVRDQYNSLIGGAVVKLFRTADDSLQDSTLSHPVRGEYYLTTPFYPDTHYIVAYKTGAPDTAGATVNTLIGS